MTTVYIHPELDHLPQATDTLIPIHLYGSRPDQEGRAALGWRIYDELTRVRAPLHPVAFDFLSISLAVIAADTFVSRDDAADGWAREINLVVALDNPGTWVPVLPKLTRALNFLSGDVWSLSFEGGGDAPPAFNRRVSRKIDPRACDSACLFSGGLDSAIGALDLRADGGNPFLVSHAYTHDAAKQEAILPRLGTGAVRFGAQASPIGWLDHGNDVQMRTRSFNFLAMGVLMAAALLRPGVERTTLFVPENGLIALNPPLTRRRIGALSTRTTHPYYLHLIGEVLDQVGLPISLMNPYAHKTKGEMMAECRDQARLATIANGTVSCGKWKRTGEQCGRCVPCLIRRAAFHRAGMDDATPYQAKGVDLHQFFEHDEDPDDLMAMLLAARRLDTMDVDRWIAMTGPMPLVAADRAGRVNAARRGMMEVRDFLRSEDLL